MEEIPDGEPAPISWTERAGRVARWMWHLIRTNGELIDKYGRPPFGIPRTEYNARVADYESRQLSATADEIAGMRPEVGILPGWAEVATPGAVREAAAVVHKIRQEPD